MSHLLHSYQYNVRAGCGYQNLVRYGGHWVLTCCHPWEVCKERCTYHCLGVPWLTLPVLWGYSHVVKYMYLPCCGASGQPERIWWMVGCLWPFRGQLSLFLTSSVSSLVGSEGCQFLLSGGRTFGLPGGPAWYSSRLGLTFPILTFPGFHFGQLVSSVLCRISRPPAV